MIFSGGNYGIHLFPGGKFQWFSDLAAAEAAEAVEIAKFTARDRAREAERMARLGLTEPARTYTISLCEPIPKRAARRGRG